MRCTPAILARAVRGLAAFGLVVLGLAGCKADEGHLASLLPPEVVIRETLGSEARSFNCARASFSAEVPEAALQGWTRLGRLFDAKLSECIPTDEQVRWKQAIARGTAHWLVIQHPEKAHVWFDTETGRLQVLTLQQDG